MTGIRAKLLAGFGAVLVMLAIVGGIGWRNTVASSAAFANLYDDELTQLQDLSTALRLLYEAAAWRDGHGLRHVRRRSARGVCWLPITSGSRTIDDTMRRVAANDLSSQERQSLQTWNQAYPQFLAVRHQVIALVDQGRLDEAAVLRDGDGTSSVAASGRDDEGADRIPDRVGGGQAQ